LHPRIVVLTALAVVAWGCGSSDGTPRPSQAEIDDFVSRFCNALVSCCVKLNVPDASEGACEANVRQKMVNYNVDAGRACIGQLAQVSGADGKSASCVPLGTSLADPCARIFDGHYGSTAPGGTCMNDSDCAAAPGGPDARSICAGGQCKWELPGVAGDGPCAGETGGPEFGWVLSREYDNEPTGYICSRDKGLYCTSLDDPAGSCQPVKPLGAPCSGARECATLRCDAGQCAPPLEMGDSCRGTPCAGDAYCNDVFVCVTKVPAGASCSKDEECVSGICDGTTCSALTIWGRAAIGLYCT
jgi:hypothetical protein